MSPSHQSAAAESAIFWNNDSINYCTMLLRDAALPAPR